MLHNMFNVARYNALPANYKAILLNASHHAHTWMQARYDAQNPAALRQLVAAGTQLRPFSLEVLEACLKATNEVNAETAAANADFKRVMDHANAFRGEQYLWWQVAEYTYDTFMIRSRARG